MPSTRSLLLPLATTILCFSVCACRSPHAPDSPAPTSTRHSSPAINLRHQVTPPVLPASETALLRKAADDGKRAGNREVCGALLLRPDGRLTLYFADNESAAPHSFRISPESLRRMDALARSTDASVVGTFHSHPSGIAEPGTEDLHGEEVGNLILIHSCLTGETRLWAVAEDGGTRRAVEMPVQVNAPRPRSSSPLPPSRVRPGLAADLRSRP